MKLLHRKSKQKEIKDEQKEKDQKPDLTGLHSDPEAINSSSKLKAYRHPHHRQKRENVDYKLENEKLAEYEPVRSYILPKDSWGLLDGPSVIDDSKDSKDKK